MNSWIKYLENYKLAEAFQRIGEDPNQQRFVGFFRKSDNYVLYCSIVEEDDGTFEYYYNCNRNLAHSHVPTNNFKTYDECKNAMVKQIISLSTRQPTMWGLFLNETTRDHLMVWKLLLEIKEEYPALYSSSPFF